MHSLVRTHHLVLGALFAALVALLAARPELVGSKLVDSLQGVTAADPAWLWAAGLAFVVMHVTGALAWRSALAACGTRTGCRDAVARYGVGSGLNAVAPAHLGSAARIALFGRIVEGDGGVWRVGGVAAAVGAVRGVWLAGVLTAAAATGAAPAWPLAVLAGVFGVAAAVALGSRRIRTRARFAHLLDGFRELGRRPRALLAVAALTAGGMALKLAAAGAIAMAFGVDRPVLTALVLVPAVELAAVMPLTPGNTGIASAAIALALGATGVDAETALATGIAFGAVETLAAVAIGAAGALALFGTTMRPALRFAVAAAGSSAVASACALTVIGPLL
jgi:uncharacterized membrane protein YbhN (UPF0104 family)